METKKIKLGRVGLVPKGAYSPDATYGRMHVVTYKNTTYWSKQEGNTGHEPLGEDDWWGILVDGQAAYAGAFNANEATVRANTAAEKAEHTNAAVETAEQERRSAETERNIAEEQRKAQAQSNAEAEQARADAEQSRVEAETQRVEAEERRASEETLRAAAEDTRKSDEADRIAYAHLKDTPRGMGFCFAFWHERRRALKQFGISWRDPHMMNPRVMFD